jgi:thymidylate synthase (FAD)
MKIVKASTEILAYTPELAKIIEVAGRTAYKSGNKINDNSADEFIKRIILDTHHTVLEHGAITVRFICDRGIAMEIIRHRLASYTMESTRYCNYSKDKFDNQLTFILPYFWDCSENEFKDDIIPYQKRATLWSMWYGVCQRVEETYLAMLQQGASPQEARSILLNSLKTEIIATANPREWRHIFKLRCDPAAHPQMREVMIPLKEKFSELWPSIFGDLVSKQGE